MAQTNQTVNQLVIKAHTMIGEFDPFDVIKQNYITQGIDLLNDLINSYSENAYLVPYTKAVQFETEAGQANYVFTDPGTPLTPEELGAVLGTDKPPLIIPSSRLTSVDYMQLKFSLDDSLIRSLRDITRTNLYNSNILETAGGFPGVFLVEKGETFTNVRLYPSPDKRYFMTLRGKFYINKFEDSQPITNMPLGEQRFLRYALARELTEFFPTSNWSPKAESEYQKMHDERMGGNDIDMTSNPVDIIGRRDRDYSGAGLTILVG